MGRQYNKVQNNKRRKAYLKRKKAALKAKHAVASGEAAAAKPGSPAPAK